MIRKKYIVTAAMLALLASSTAMEALARFGKNNHAPTNRPEVSQDLNTIIIDSTVKMHDFSSNHIAMATTPLPAANPVSPNLYASPPTTQPKGSATAYNSGTRQPADAKMAENVAGKTRDILRKRAHHFGRGHVLEVKHAPDLTRDIYAEEMAHTTTAKQAFVTQMRTFSVIF